MTPEWRTIDEYWNHCSSKQNPSEAQGRIRNKCLARVHLGLMHALTLTLARTADSTSWMLAHPRSGGSRCLMLAGPVGRDFLGAQSMAPPSMGASSARFLLLMAARASSSLPSSATSYDASLTSPNWLAKSYPGTSANTPKILKCLTRARRRRSFFKLSNPVRDPEELRAGFGGCKALPTILGFTVRV